MVANLVMEDVEERALSSAPHRPPFWKRYVDDVCTVLDCDDVGGFCEHLNSIEPSINFTFELEQDHKLPFLDVEIFHHSNGSLSTKVYRKTTHMDKYLQFDSHHPLAHKLAVTKTLYKRASTHCTCVEDAVSEGRHVSKALAMNGYPRRYRERRVISHGKGGEDESSQSRETRIPTVVLPYIRNLSEAIRRILTPLDIHTAFRPMRTLRDILVHVKDPVPPEAKSGTVYRVSCSGCPASYVGQTGRTVRDRVKEHK